VGVRVAVRQSRSVLTKRAPHPAPLSSAGEGPFTGLERRNTRPCAASEQADSRAGDVADPVLLHHPVLRGVRGALRVADIIEPP
jgi:hypothetical protein